MDMNIKKYVQKSLMDHVIDAYRDDDGIWIEFDEHVGHEIEGSTKYATVHADSIRDLRSEICYCKLY